MPIKQKIGLGFLFIGAVLLLVNQTMNNADTPESAKRLVAVALGAVAFFVVGTIMAFLGRPKK
jgi:hypothetical protein